MEKRPQTELPPKAQVVVIGSGVIGAACAYYLTQKGVRDVLVLEQGGIGAQGATAKCLGGLRTQFSTTVNIRFSLISREVFRNFEQTFGVDPLFKPYGYLFLASSPRQWSVFENTARLMSGMDVPVELLAPEEILRRWPFIDTRRLAGGSFTRGDGFYGPIEVLSGFVGAARRGGALFFENTAVEGFSIFEKRVSKIRTSGGREIEADVVINAAGPWSGRLAAAAGLKLPVQPLQRYLFFTDAFGGLPAVFPLILDIDSGWYMKREGAGLLLGGPTGERSFADSVPFDAQEWTADASIRCVPLLERARIVRGWAGHYEMTPDRHAVIGAFPELENFICATGFSGHGFQHAPAAGMIVAEIVAGGRAESEDIHPLRPTRFRENDLIYEPLTAVRE